MSTKIGIGITTASSDANTTAQIHMVENRVAPRLLILMVGSGLSNRLRAIVSARLLARRAGRTLVVLWPRDAHCRAPMRTLLRASTRLVPFGDENDDNREDDSSMIFEEGGSKEESDMFVVDFELTYPEGLIDQLFERAATSNRNHEATPNHQLAVHVMSYFDNPVLDLGGGGRRGGLVRPPHGNGQQRTRAPPKPPPQHLYVRSKYWLVSRNHGDTRGGSPTSFDDDGSGGGSGDKDDETFGGEAGAVRMEIASLPLSLRVIANLARQISRIDNALLVDGTTCIDCSNCRKNSGMSSRCGGGRDVGLKKAKAPRRKLVVVHMRCQASIARDLPGPIPPHMATELRTLESAATVTRRTCGAPSFLVALRRLYFLLLGSKVVDDEEDDDDMDDYLDENEIDESDHNGTGNSGDGAFADSARGAIAAAATQTTTSMESTSDTSTTKVQGVTTMTVTTTTTTTTTTSTTTSNTTASTPAAAATGGVVFYVATDVPSALVELRAGFPPGAMLSYDDAEVCPDETDNNRHEMWGNVGVEVGLPSEILPWFEPRGSDCMSRALVEQRLLMDARAAARVLSSWSTFSELISRGAATTTATEVNGCGWLGGDEGENDDHFKARRRQWERWRWWQQRQRSPDGAVTQRRLAVSSQGRVEERTPHSHPVAQLARHCAVALCVASFVLPLGEYNEEEEAAGLAAAHTLALRLRQRQLPTPAPLPSLPQQQQSSAWIFGAKFPFANWRMRVYYDEDWLTQDDYNRNSRLGRVSAAAGRRRRRRRREALVFLASRGVELVPPLASVPSSLLSSPSSTSLHASAWLVATDSTVDRYIVRSLLVAGGGPLSTRDEAAVADWALSGLPLHRILDHPDHFSYCISASGVLWGGLRGAIDPRVVWGVMARQIPNSDGSASAHDGIVKSGDFSRTTDAEKLLLQTAVAPAARRAGMLLHASVEYRHPAPHSSPSYSQGSNAAPWLWGGAVERVPMPVERRGKESVGEPFRVSIAAFGNCEKTTIEDADDNGDFKEVPAPPLLLPPLMPIAEKQQQKPISLAAAAMALADAEGAGHEVASSLVIPLSAGVMDIAIAIIEPKDGTSYRDGCDGGDGGGELMILPEVQVRVFGSGPHSDRMRSHPSSFRLCTAVDDGAASCTPLLEGAPLAPLGYHRLVDHRFAYTFTAFLLFKEEGSGAATGGGGSTGGERRRNEVIAEVTSIFSVISDFSTY